MTGEEFGDEEAEDCTEKHVGLEQISRHISQNQRSTYCLFFRLILVAKSYLKISMYIISTWVLLRSWFYPADEKKMLPRSYSVK